MNLAEEQRKLRERMEEKEIAVQCTPTALESFYAVNMFPKDGHRYAFGISPASYYDLKLIQLILPDCIVVRNYDCHRDNLEFVMTRIRNTPGVVMKSQLIADVQGPLGLMQRLDGIFEEYDLTKKQP